MKHSFPVTLALIALFVFTQVLGLWLLARTLDVDVMDGVITTSYDDTLLGPRPETTASAAVIMLLLGILLGTLILLVLIRFRKRRIWKAWFFFAVWVTVSITLAALVPILDWIAWVLGAGLALWKVLKPNVIVHNLTEVMTYTGIGLIFAPLLNGSLLWGMILLAVISLYDMYAVWKSKHMVKMAEFQAESKVFAGLFVPYSGKMPKGPTTLQKTASEGRTRNAILGGGDLAFPLLFAGVVLDHLVRSGMTVMQAFWQTMFVVAGATVAIALLFILAKKDRFYPAMPFLSAGCLLGYLVTLVV